MFEEKRSRRKPYSSAAALSVVLSLAGAECELAVRSSSFVVLVVAVVVVVGKDWIIGIN